MALTIAELVGYVRLNNDDFVQKHSKTKKDLEDLADDWGKAGSKADTAAMSFLKAANSLSNIPTAAAAVQGTITFLGQMSGVLGLIPAAGAGALLAITTLKVGMSGFGDALKESDPKKFAEDLKTLAPEARESAIAVRDLRGQWDDLHKSVQNNLFEGLATHIHQLGTTYIPVLKDGMFGIAAQFNYAAQKAAQFLEQGQQVSTVRDIFGNTKQVVGNLADTLQPLISILLDVVAVGSDLLPSLTGGFGGAAQKAADFVHHARETGQLREWMESGLRAVGQLVQLLKNLGSIVVSVFTGLHAGGTGLMSTLLKVTGIIADFLKSFEGQQALHALGSALNAVSTVVTQVLLTAFQQLAPVLVQLAPPFAELARQVGSALVTALRIAGPLLLDLASFISHNIDWLGPLAIAIYGGVKAFEAISAAMKIVNILAATNPWLIVIAATIALAVLIVTHWEQIKTALAAAWKWIENTARTAWEHVKSAIIDPITKAASWIADRIGDIIGFFVGLPKRIGGAISGLFDIVKEPFVKAFNWVRDEAVKIGEWIKQRIKDAINVTDWGSSIGDLQARAKAAGANVPGRASGGPVTANRPYMVGENRRPELFVPESNGTIVPLDNLGGGGATVNIDTFNAFDSQSPGEIAGELDWLARAAGY